MTENAIIPVFIWQCGQMERKSVHWRTDGPDGELLDIQQAFIDEAAVQCGFCTPGVIMSAVEILDSGREYTR